MAAAGVSEGVNPFVRQRTTHARRQAFGTEIWPAIVVPLENLDTHSDIQVYISVCWT
jgi:hypothetical protein